MFETLWYIYWNACCIKVLWVWSTFFHVPSIIIIQNQSSHVTLKHICTCIHNIPVCIMPFLPTVFGNGIFSCIITIQGYHRYFTHHVCSVLNNRKSNHCISTKIWLHMQNECIAEHIKYGSSIFFESYIYCEKNPNSVQKTTNR